MTTTNPAPSTKTWAAIFVLAVSAAIIVTTEFIPVGLLPEVADDLGVSLGVAGSMILVPGLSAAIFAPLVIVGAGRLNRRKMILGLGVLVLLSNGIAAIAPSFPVVLAARILLGIAIGGFWAVVPPLGFRLGGPEFGTRATSIILTGLSVGTVIGLPAGQLLGDAIGWRATFGVAAGAAGLIVVAQLAALPSLPAASDMRFSHLAGVFRVPIARTAILAGGIATIGQFAASTFVTPFLLDSVHMSSATAAALFLGYGVAGAAGTLLGSPLVSRSRIWTFVGAAGAFGIVLVTLPILTEVPILVAVLFVVWGLLWGMVPLALQTLMVTAVPGAPEASSAVLISVLQLGIAVGAALGGLLVDSAGVDAVFVVAGVTAVAGGLIAVVYRNGLGRRPSGLSTGEVIADAS